MQHILVNEMVNIYHVLPSRKTGGAVFVFLIVGSAIHPDMLFVDYYCIKMEYLTYMTSFCGCALFYVIHGINYGMLYLNFLQLF